MIARTPSGQHVSILAFLGAPEVFCAAHCSGPVVAGAGAGACKFSGPPCGRGAHPEAEAESDFASKLSCLRVFFCLVP